MQLLIPFNGFDNSGQWKCFVIAAVQLLKQINKINGGGIDLEQYSIDDFIALLPAKEFPHGV